MNQPRQRPLGNILKLGALVPPPYERAQRGYSGRLTPAYGEAGYGIYAYPSSNQAMRRYYGKPDEDLVSITPHANARIVDLTTPQAKAAVVEVSIKIARGHDGSKGDDSSQTQVTGTSATPETIQKHPWAIAQYLYDMNADAFLVEHSGPGIPSGKQLVILREEAFTHELKPILTRPAPKVAAKATIQSMQAAISATLGLTTPFPDALAGTMVINSDQLPAAWQPSKSRSQAKNHQYARLLQSARHASAQAFYDPLTGISAFIADRISAGDESSVFLHEITHKHGRSALGVPVWRKLVDQVRGWGKLERSSNERKIHDAAMKRAVGSKVSGIAFDEELFAYAVEEAMARGVVPSASALDGSAEQWLDAVVTSIRQVGHKLTGRDLEPLTQQDVVDLAYALAQLDSPARSEKIKQALKEAISALPVNQTTQFKRWFGQSKAVDGRGMPEVFYHGTKADFSEFKRTNSGEFGPAIYLTNNPREAVEYGDAKGWGGPIGTQIMPVFVSVQNPYTKGVDAFWKEFGKEGDSDAQAILRAQAASYDGIMATRKDRYYDNELREFVERDELLTHAVVFDPASVKSAIGNNGDFDAQNPDIRHSAGSRPWYSELSRQVAANKQTSMPADMWLGWLNALKGVKADEIEWSGVKEWLALQSGKVAKTEVLDYLNANGVQVQETVLEGNVDAVTKLKSALRGTEYSVELDNIEGEVFYLGPDGNYISYGELPENIRDIVDKASSQADGKTQYEKYVLPGGSNYREVLLTLPASSKQAGSKGTITFTDEDVLDDFLMSLSSEGFENLDYGAMSDDSGERLTVEFDGLTPSEKINFELLLQPLAHTLVYEEGAAGAPLYRSTHWVQPNVLAHLRLNDRTDADGNKVLFVEEIQADWGQDIKKKGASGTVEAALKTNGMTRAEFEAMPAEDQQFAIDETLKLGLPPAAPFVTATDKWLTLALKRVVKMAVDGGYDKVAFVNGAQNTDRYELGKQIYSLRVRKNTSGNFVLQSKGTVEDKTFGHLRSNVTQAELPSLIGKEFTAKVVNDLLAHEQAPKLTALPDDFHISMDSHTDPAAPYTVVPAAQIHGKPFAGRHATEERAIKAALELIELERSDGIVYSGLDFKVGGDGLKAFYDTIVPNTTNALLKKLGGEKVQPINILTSDGVNPTRKMIQPGFTITPAMREIAADGMALFSQIDNIKTGFGTSKVIDAQGSPKLSPIFHSELARQIGKSSMKQAPAADWKAFIVALTRKGVKQDEIEWTGINEFLDLQEGKVSRDALLNFLDANGVQVTETMLGGGGFRDRITVRAWAALTPDERKLVPGYDYAGENDLVGYLDGVPQGLFRDQWTQTVVNSILADMDVDMSAKSDAKYEGQQLPGGQQYRELLLTLPPKLSDYGKWLDGSSVTAEDIETPFGRETAERVAGINAFQSSHWAGTPNVLAHIRFNERTDAEGNRVLFIEEIQSDWGQNGKKLGFAFQKTKDARAAEAQSRIDAAMREARDAMPTQDWDDFTHGECIQVMRAHDHWVLAGQMLEAVSDLHKSQGLNGEVPPAPFVTHTEKWVTLVIKRMIRMAVDEGFDKVAFINGDQSAERNGLNKQVKSIAFRVSGDENYRLVIHDIDGAIKDIPPTLDADGLAQYVGIELSKHIIAAATKEEQTLSGLDLKVGGEGMRAFYDRIVPNIANEVLRKLGGEKLEGITLVNKSADFDFLELDNATPAELAQLEAGGITLNQRGFTITDKLRELGSQSMPLFSLKPKALSAFTRHSRVKGIVYHATSSNFTTFDTEGKSDLGAHFGTREQANKAAGRGRGDGSAEPNIMPVYINLQNPIRFKDMGTFHADGIAPEMARKGLISKADAKRIEKEIDADWTLRKRYDREFRDLLKSKGYDGVIYKNTTEGAGDSFLVFEPTQVKSALSNSGRYDPTNPDIRFSQVNTEVEASSARHPRPALTRTDGFKAWFAGSKMVDPEGMPLRMYHGTNTDFSSFETGDESHVGFHFGTAEQASRRLASRGRTRAGSQVMPVYLSIKNPLHMRDAGDWSNPWAFWQVANKSLSGALDHLTAQEMTDDSPRQERLGKVIAAIKALGYDGITYRNQVEGTGTSCIAFEPGQIKSALANSGEFDAGSSDIRFSQTQTGTTPARMAFEDRFGDLQESSYEDRAQYITDAVVAAGVINGVRVEMQPWSPNGQALGVELTDLYADAPGAGGGSKTMAVLSALSDSLQISVYLRPAEQRNRAFYSKFGFVECERHYGFMARYPAFDDDEDADWDMPISKGKPLVTLDDSPVAPNLIEDIPNARWLQEQVDYAVKQGRNRFGVPFMGKITARYDQPIKVPMSALVKLFGQRHEQANVRADDLAAIKAIMSSTGKLPLGENGEVYVPYIEVAHNGEAWVNEGSHRIMAAAELGWLDLPIQLRYFDGGERVADGPLFPAKLTSPAPANSPTPLITDSPEFKAWFVDSVVTDEDKAPLLLYHGTKDVPEGIAVFNTEQPEELGAHFGTIDQAQQFANHEGGFIQPVYLSLKRPLRLEDRGGFTEEYVRPQLDALGVPESTTGAALTGGAYLRDRLIQAGYDSVVYLNRREGAHDPFGPDGMDGDELSSLTDVEVLAHYGDVQDSYIALRPEQIKSSLGNAETFDVGHADIRLSQISVPAAPQSAKPAPIDAVRPGDVFRTPTSEALTVLRQKPGGLVEVRIQGKRLRLGDFKNNDLKAWERIGRADFADGAYTTPQALIDLAKTERVAPNGLKDWFGDSKIVDAAGQPLVVFHGTGRSFSTFDEHTQGETFADMDLAVPDDGFWFANDADRAHWYASISAKKTADGAPNIMPVYLKMQNPYIYTAEQFANEGISEMLSLYEIEQMGYDGVIVERGEYGEGEQWADLLPVIQRDYAVFKPDQIKSATGNIGTFDTTNSDIRFSLNSDMGHEAANPGLADNPAFRKWFDGSKVVDFLGHPLEVYHGTDADIHAFDPSRIGTRFGADDRGFFFTTDPKSASNYAANDAIGRNMQTGGNVIPAYVALKKPLIIDDVFLKSEGMSPVGITEDSITFWDNYQGLIHEWVDAKKSDGVIIVDNSFQPSGQPTKLIVAFKPEQIKSARGNNGQFDAQSADIRFSFAGEQAVGHDAAALHIAQQSLRAGDAAEAVRSDTGWHMGPDLRWRFEISDHEAKLKPAIKSLSRGGYEAGAIKSVTYLQKSDGTYDLTLNPPSPQKTSDFVVLSSVTQDVMHAVLPQEVFAQVLHGDGQADYINAFEDAKRIDADFTFEGFNALPLDQVLDHPKLFDAYPTMRSLMVQVDPKLGNDAALVVKADGQRVIILGTGQQLTSLIHETQHAVQAIEGFARGGSPRRSDVEQSREYKAFNFASRTLPLRPTSSESNRVMDLYDQIPTVLQAYRRLTGEVEARNVQARQPMNDWQRRITPPSVTADVAEGDQITVMDQP